MFRRILMAVSVQAIMCMAWAQSTKGEPQIPVYPALENEGSFSMIMVPDPQSYVKFAANQPLFDL